MLLVIVIPCTIFSQNQSPFSFVASAFQVCLGPGSSCFDCNAHLTALIAFFAYTHSSHFITLHFSKYQQNSNYGIFYFNCTSKSNSLRCALQERSLQERGRGDFSQNHGMTGKRGMDSYSADQIGLEVLGYESGEALDQGA